MKCETQDWLRTVGFGVLWSVGIATIVALIIFYSHQWNHEAWLAWKAAQPDTPLTEEQFVTLMNNHLITYRP